MSETTEATKSPAKDANPDLAFFTGAKDPGPRVLISINKNTKAGAPKFVGTVGETKVGGYIRNGSKGSFIALVGDRDKEGKYPQLGAGNVIVNRNGKVRLSVKMTGSEETLWAGISENMTQDMLVECGLNLEILAAKTEAAKTEAK